MVLDRKERRLVGVSDNGGCVDSSRISSSSSSSNLPQIKGNEAKRRDATRLSLRLRAAQAVGCGRQERAETKEERDERKNLSKETDQSEQQLMYRFLGRRNR